MRRPRALVSTIEPVDGGVPAMTTAVTRMLEELDIEPVFAWYAPWSTHPRLSVPLHALPSGRKPGQMQRRVYGDHGGHGLGAWLPELEFTHYLPRRAWRELVAGCDLHLSVTGNPLCAVPFARLGIPFLAWWPPHGRRIVSTASGGFPGPDGCSTGCSTDRCCSGWSARCCGLPGGGSWR